jgi:hypothetical protein
VPGAPEPGAPSAPPTRSRRPFPLSPARSFNHKLLYQMFKQQIADAMLARLRRAAGVPIRLPGLGMAYA